MSSIEKFVDKLKEAKGRSPAGEPSRSGSVAGPGTPQGTSRIIELNLEAMHRAGMLVPGDSRSLVAEEYRSIKRPLLRNAFGLSAIPNGNLIMVTSALPREGKSFTAINLAMSIVMELDSTALLIEADVVRPSFAQYMGFADEQNGLVDYLSDPDVSLESLLLRTNVPKLSILPSGPNHPRSTELLASQNMRDLCRELGSRYPDRIIIFDAPPILVSSEAHVLSTLVGQVVFVVEAGRTPQSSVDDAVSRLDPAQAVGIVLNKSADADITEYGYYGANGA